MPAARTGQQLHCKDQQCCSAGSPRGCAYRRWDIAFVRKNHVHFHACSFDVVHGASTDTQAAASPLGDNGVALSRATRLWFKSGIYGLKGAKARSQYLNSRGSPGSCFRRSHEVPAILKRCTCGVAQHVACANLMLQPSRSLRSGIAPSLYGCRNYRLTMRASSSAEDFSWSRLGTPRDQLVLQNTLPTGQSFRWFKSSGEADFTGVIGQRVVRCPLASVVAFTFSCLPSSALIKRMQVQVKQLDNDVMWRVAARGSKASPGTTF